MVSSVLCITSQVERTKKRNSIDSQSKSFLMVFATLSHQVNFISGGLTKIQETFANPGSVLQEYVTIIDNCYPEETVRY